MTLDLHLTIRTMRMLVRVLKGEINARTHVPVHDMLLYLEGRLKDQEKINLEKYNRRKRVKKPLGE
jgi:hypothetical protein